MYEMFNIAGKKAIVTGGSGGLGKSVVEALLENGAVVAVLDISPNIHEMVRTWVKSGYKVFAVECDLGSPDELLSGYTKALDLLGGYLDILFNVAGIQRRHKSEEFPIEDWENVIKINLTVPFVLCQYAAKQYMKQKSGGKIINIASMLSFFGGYMVPAYTASKGGIAQITKAFCNEWAQHGINVNAIAPGYMDTQMNINLVNDPNRNKEILTRIPAGRWGVGNDMKGLVIFLSSSASDYINGAIIPCDGGYLAK